MYLAIFVVAALVALTVFVRWLEPRVAFVPFPGESETPRDLGIDHNDAVARDEQVYWSAIDRFIGTFRAHDSRR